MTLQRTINKRLLSIGSHVRAISKLPLIGNIDDEEGFLDDVTNVDVEYRLTVYITKPECDELVLENVMRKLTKTMERRGFLIEINII